MYCLHGPAAWQGLFVAARPGFAQSPIVINLARPNQTVFSTSETGAEVLLLARSSCAPAMKLFSTRREQKEPPVSAFAANPTKV